MKRAWMLGLALSAAAACGSDAGPPDGRVIDGPPPGGTFSLAWTMHDQANAVLACGDISANVVSVTLLSENAGFGVVDTFSCSSALGTTRMLEPGLYTVTVELDGGGGVLAPTTKFMHVEIKSGQDTPLGNVDFMVVATGGVAFQLSASGQSTNCTAAGANIDAMTLELETPSGTCIPATFDVAAGAGTSASTYVSDCNTLPAGPCLEKDQKITVTGLRSGQVQVVEVGDVGGKNCWPSTDTLTVPVMNAVKDYGSLLMIHDALTCP